MDIQTLLELGRFVQNQPEYLLTLLRSVDFDSKDGCWLWKGATIRRGYGQVNAKSYWGETLVHRIMYKLVHGDIPKGLELDHQCEIPSCCNPAHLIAVTHDENVRRTMVEQGWWGKCRQGHLMSGDNLGGRPGMQRYCRTCAQRRAREYLEKNREYVLAYQREYSRRKRAAIKQSIA